MAANGNHPGGSGLFAMTHVYNTANFPTVKKVKSTNRCCICDARLLTTHPAVTCGVCSARMHPFCLEKRMLNVGNNICPNTGCPAPLYMGSETTTIFENYSKLRWYLNHRNRYLCVALFAFISYILLLITHLVVRSIMIRANSTPLHNVTTCLGENVGEITISDYFMCYTVVPFTNFDFIWTLGIWSLFWTIALILAVVLRIYHQEEEEEERARRTTKGIGVVTSTPKPPVVPKSDSILATQPTAYEDDIVATLGKKSPSSTKTVNNNDFLVVVSDTTDASVSVSSKSSLSVKPLHPTPSRKNSRLFEVLTDLVDSARDFIMTETGHGGQRIPVSTIDGEEEDEDEEDESDGKKQLLGGGGTKEDDSDIDPIGDDEADINQL